MRVSLVRHTATFDTFPVIADSAGLSIQTLIPPFRHIPRAIFTVLAFIIYTAAGVAGRQHFSSILSNFLAVVSVRCGFPNTSLLILASGKLGYWLAFWVVIILEEHYIFRAKGGLLGGYDLHAYDTPAL